MRSCNEKLFLLYQTSTIYHVWNFNVQPGSELKNKVNFKVKKTLFWFQTLHNIVNQEHMSINITAKANACAIPNPGAFFCQRGEKWMSIQIFPPLYIFSVFPSSSGSFISIGVRGYPTGIWFITQV